MWRHLATICCMFALLQHETYQAREASDERAGASGAGRGFEVCGGTGRSSAACRPRSRPVPLGTLCPALPACAPPTPSRPACPRPRPWLCRRALPPPWPISPHTSPPLRAAPQVASSRPRLPPPRASPRPPRRLSARPTFPPSALDYTLRAGTWRREQPRRLGSRHGSRPGSHRHPASTHS
eukprot:scaffold31587_cov51-Phaeocystis_antarctica.AAC.2